MSHLLPLSLILCLKLALVEARVVPLPHDRSMSPMSAQNSDRLAFSTPTSISAVSMLNLGVANDVTFQASEVVHEDNYLIDEFSISFKDNLALYGKNTIYARPIGPGQNYLKLDNKKSIDIAFEGHFTVDWVDYNVYAFKDHKLSIHNMLTTGYSAAIYNGSTSVRNLVVEYKRQFLAWISNDNNIMKAAKDGSSPVNVWTEKKGPIHCMTVSPANDRFYFVIATKTVKKKKELKKKSQRYDSDVLEYVTVKYDVYWLNIYSIDYDARFQPMKENTIKVASKWSNATHIAKYHQSLYLIVTDYEIDDDDDKEGAGGWTKVYQMYQVNQGEAQPKPLKEGKNWPFTALHVAWYNPGSSELCRQKNCPHICVQMDEKTAKCLCKDNAATCAGTGALQPVNSASHSNTSAPSGASTKKNGGSSGSSALNSGSQVEKQDNKSASNSNIWIWIIAIVIIVGCALCMGYFGYSYFYAGEEQDETVMMTDMDASSRLSKMGSATAKMFGFSKAESSIAPSSKITSKHSKSNAKSSKSNIPQVQQTEMVVENEDNNSKSWFQRTAGKLLALFGFGPEEQPDAMENFEEGQLAKSSANSTVQTKKKKKKHDNKKSMDSRWETDTGSSSTAKESKTADEKNGKHRKAKDKSKSKSHKDKDVATTDDEADNNLVDKKKKKKKRSKAPLVSETGPTTSETTTVAAEDKCNTTGENETDDTNKATKSATKKNKLKGKRKHSKDADKTAEFSPTEVAKPAPKSPARKSAERDLKLEDSHPSLVLTNVQAKPDSSITASMKANDSDHVSSAIKLTTKPYIIGSEVVPQQQQKKRKHKHKKSHGQNEETVIVDEEIITSGEMTGTPSASATPTTAGTTSTVVKTAKSASDATQQKKKKKKHKSKDRSK